MAVAAGGVGPFLTPRCRSPQVPGAAAGVPVLAVGHAAAGQGQEDAAGAVGERRGRGAERHHGGCAGGRSGPPFPDPGGAVPALSSVPRRAGGAGRAVPAAPLPHRVRDLRHQGHLEERRHPRLHRVSAAASGVPGTPVPRTAPIRHSPPSAPRRFIGSGIRHCFTRNLAPHLPRFLPAYFAMRGPEAAACLFLCVTAERCGRRAVLLLCAVLTGTASLLLLALTQCKEPGVGGVGGGSGVSGVRALMATPPLLPAQTSWSSSC